ncbi:hypothetical protein NX059_009747 [Plenodomus lindquistii]|nr:hypothetical protein NX059_009747 [Plenodomus lindquistii]
MLSFGYTPAEVAPGLTNTTNTQSAIADPLQLHRPLGPTLHHLYSLRPQTLAFSLCDSPVGLLAALLDVIHTREVAQDPLASRSISPFLSPVELEMQEARAAARVNGGNGITTQTTTSTYGLESVEEEGEVDGESAKGGGEGMENVKGTEDGKGYTWSPTEILNFVMLQWLPGPEAALRWLRRAHLDTAALQDTYSPVPLGVSTFYARKSARQSSEAGTATPLMWGTSSWNMAWVKRHQQPATLPGFEAPDLLVTDLRDFVGSLVKTGRLGKLGKTAENGSANG